MSSLVFVVEDEALVMVLLRQTLEDAGYAVREAESGAEALELLESEADTFAAVVTDVNLPGVDGWHVARRARELKPTLPVVYVTGDSAHEWAAQGVPGSVLVEKPFAPAQIVTAVSSLLNVSSIGAQPGHS